MNFIRNKLISGVESRKYRLELSKKANNVKDDIKAVKFKLDLSEIEPELKDRILNFSDYSEIYNALSGTDEGSINHFLFNVILNGFRIFPTKTEAQIYAASSAYKDNDFRNKITEKLGIELKDFIPSKIISKLSKSVRSTGGKDNSFSENVLLTEFNKTFAKIKVSDEEKNKIELFFKELIKPLLNNFSSFNELNKNLESACALIDTALYNNGCNTPSLKKMYLNSRNLIQNLYPGTTIVFNPDFKPFNYDIKQEPYLVVATVLSNKTDETEPSKFVKNNFTTENFNGLSWLLNTGLDLFRTQEINSLCKYFNVPDNHKQIVQNLKNIAVSVPVISAKTSEKFSKYSKFRSMIGGHLDSWITNYVKRITEIKNLIEKLPSEITLPDSFIVDNKDFLVYAGLNRKEIELLLNKINDRNYRLQISNSLKKLLGEIPECNQNDLSCVEEFSLIVNRFSKIKNQLFNILEQSENYSHTIFGDLKKKCSKELETWKKFEELPKLNTLSGGVDNANEELKKQEKLLPQIITKEDEYFEKIKGYLKTQNLKREDLFEKYKNKEQDLLLKANRNPSEYNLEELAFRHVLNIIANSVKHTDDQAVDEIKQWFKQERIFDSKNNFNKFFINKLGLLYKGPFNRSRNSVYKFSSEIKDFSTLFNELLTLVEKIIVNNSDNKMNFAVINLKTAYQSIYINLYDELLPNQIVKPEFPLDLENNLISEQLAFELNKEMCESSVIRKVIALYKSIIYGIQVKLSREKFYLRNNFTWLENHSLFYVPKKCNWKIPERYLKLNLYQQLLKNNLMVFTDKPNEIDVPATFNITVKALNKIPELNKFLLQLPHDWLYEMPYKTNKDDCIETALEFNKDFISKNKVPYAVKKINRTIAARLIGPSKYKNMLDSMLISDRITFGDMNLLCDQKVSQLFKDNSVNLKHEELTQSIVVPLKYEGFGRDPERKADFENLIAIDQGEYGFSYAVFSLKDIGNAKAEPIAKGTMHMKTIKQFNRTVDAYRKNHKQSLQKFNQRFDTTAFNYREKLVGDIFGFIVALMNKYNAFPVLEHEVSELEEGSRKLDLVYKTTNSCFLKNQVDAQESFRKTHWNGADYWNTDYQLERITPDGKSEITDFRLYPGAFVSAYMTSKICHICNRNAFDLLKQIEEQSPDKTFPVINGEVTVAGEVLKLYKQPSNSQIVPNLKMKNKKYRTYNSIKENAPWTEPYNSNKPLDIRALRSLCLKNLRRKQKSQRAIDSTASAYYCIFKDCPCHNKYQYADVNAAINIGRRLLSRLTLKKKKENS